MSSFHPTLSLADLEAWPATQVGVGLFGHPVAHSLSPVIHTAALAALACEDAQFAAWRYAKFDIAPEDLGHALLVAHAKGFRGLNFTTPHKEIVLDHAESADAFTRAASAANTLVRTETGWRASNTDGGGLSDALRADLGVELRGRDVILLGAGGAARAAAVQCLRDQVASLWIGNRGRERLDALLAHLAPLASGAGLHGFVFAQPDSTLPANAIVINATAAGLRDASQSPVDLHRLPRPAVVYEMIYNPPVTALLRQAAELGIVHANGLGMLVFQGARSLAMWTGKDGPADVMRQAALATAGGGQNP
ncbi:MAG: shikimate dehydrogenase [Opitutus sp.]|nr:shikimate dehydrogenase [Opitutus sp.]